MRKLGTTDLDVFGLCLGANVFGWTADRDATFAVLDAYAAAGGNFVDTAGSYGNWVPGNPPGFSETLIGEWMAARGTRDRMVVATKASRDGGLGAAAVREKAESSLRRLQTDRIDLYYAHFDDPDTPLEETLGAFDALVREGKVRHIAASNHAPARLAEALAISDREGFARYEALQPLYNLVEREQVEGELQELCLREGVAILPFYALARGFLTGKYRAGSAPPDSPRAGAAGAYLETERGRAVLDALDEIAAAHETTVAAVALAWLLAQPGVAAPIASARDVQQLEALLPVVELALAPDELRRLTDAGA
jgi:aryl-alcohol dehydrogenase (NADP+)